MQWFNFIGGAVFGAVVSIVLDRLYRKWERKQESKVKLRVIGGVFQNIGGVEGLSFSITNLSAVPLPDYDITLFHPQKGSLTMFDSETTGELAPEQERQHRVPILLQGKPREMFPWFQHYRHQKSDNPTGEGVLFRLQMKNSKRVLYENAIIGETLANVVLDAVKTGSLLKSLSFEDSIRLQDTDRKYKQEQQEIINRIEADRQRKAS